MGVAIKWKPGVRERLAPEDFQQPLYVGAMTWRWVFWDIEVEGQPRVQLHGGEPKRGLMTVTVPFRCQGAFIFDRREGGEELGRGYCQNGGGDEMRVGDQIAWTIYLGAMP